MSRSLKDESQRKGTYCISLSPDVRDIIVRLGVGRSFSEKIESVVRKYESDSVTLFSYDTEEQKELGTPTVFKGGAIQVYCESAGKQGLCTDNEEILSILSPTPRKGNVAATIVGRLEQNGYLVQVSEDPIDVWAMQRTNDKDKCFKCKVLGEIRTILGRLEETYDHK